MNEVIDFESGVSLHELKSKIAADKKVGYLRRQSQVYLLNDKNDKSISNKSDYFVFKSNDIKNVGVYE